MSTSIILSGGHGGFDNKNPYADLPLKFVVLLGKTCSSLAPLSEEINSHSMTITNNNELLVAGGCSTKGLPSRISYVYRRNSWFLLSTLNEIRVHSSIITMPNGVYIFGGAKHPFPIDSSEFLPNGCEEWQIGPKIPLQGTFGASGVAISKDEILLSGGRGKVIDKMLIFKISTNMWYTSNLNYGRCLHASFVYKDSVIICGGINRNREIFNSTEILSLSDGSVKLGGNLNVPRRSHGMGVIDVGDGVSKLITFGGFNDSKGSLSSIEEWNETAQKWEMSKLILPGPKRWGFAFCSSPNQHLRNSVTSKWQNLIPI